MVSPGAYGTLDFSLLRTGATHGLQRRGRRLCQVRQRDPELRQRRCPAGPGTRDSDLRLLTGSSTADRPARPTGDRRPAACLHDGSQPRRRPRLPGPAAAGRGPRSPGTAFAGGDRCPDRRVRAPLRPEKGVIVPIALIAMKDPTRSCRRAVQQQRSLLLRAGRGPSPLDSRPGALPGRARRRLKSPHRLGHGHDIAPSPMYRDRWTPVEQWDFGDAPARAVPAGAHLPHTQCGISTREPPRIERSIIWVGPRHEDDHRVGPALGAPVAGITASPTSGTQHLRP